jgi:hypothetical protein
MMRSFRESIARIVANGHDVWTDGPQSEAAITTLETALNLRLPPDYRDFVGHFGGLAIYDTHVSGILENDALSRNAGWLYGDTLRFREEWELPPYLLVLQADEDAPFCFDTRHGRSSDLPVVCFELHSKAQWQVASNFGEWLQQYVFATWESDDSA